MSKYIDAEKLIAEIVKLKNGLKSLMSKFYYATNYKEWKAELSGYNAVLSIITSLQQEQPKKQLIQVKCLYPHDEFWQKNKVYTCKVWHHGDLNRDFWDVYYDYGKDPKYVQFPTIELLNEEFVIIQQESQVKQEQPEVDLDKEIDKEWAKCEPVDEGMGLESANIVNEQFDSIARHFYELGLNTKNED